MRRYCASLRVKLCLWRVLGRRHLYSAPQGARLDISWLLYFEWTIDILTRLSQTKYQPAVAWTWPSLLPARLMSQAPHDSHISSQLYDHMPDDILRQVKCRRRNRCDIYSHLRELRRYSWANRCSHHHCRLHFPTFKLTLLRGIYKILMFYIHGRFPAAYLVPLLDPVYSPEMRNHFEMGNHRLP